MTQASSLTLSFSPHLFTSAGLCSLHSTRHLPLIFKAFPTPRQPPSPSPTERVTYLKNWMGMVMSSRAAKDAALLPAHGHRRNFLIAHRKAMLSFASLLVAQGRIF